MSYRTVHLSQVKPSGFAAHLIDYLVSRLCLNPKSVLDVGCGSGGYTKEWRRAFPKAKIVGLDLDPPQIEDVQTMQFDLVGARLPGKFDLVFSKSVLEHLDPVARAGFIATVKRNLYHAGVAVVMVPDWKTCMAVFYDDYTHVAPYTVDSLRDLFAVNGLKAQVEVFWQVPFAWKHPILWSVARRFWWLVKDKDLQYRMKHAALLAVIRK